MTAGGRRPSSGTSADDFARERARIVAIATELFAVNGYHATGIAELQLSTGLTRGGLYHYIDSKESLLFEIIRYSIDSLNESCEKLLQQPHSADELFRALARDLMLHCATHRDEWAVFFREYLSLSGARRADVQRRRDRYESYWKEALRQGIRDGAFEKVDPSLAVKGVLGMFNHTYTWFNPDGPLDAETVADRFADLVILGLRPRQG